MTTTIGILTYDSTGSYQSHLLAAMQTAAPPDVQFIIHSSLRDGIPDSDVFEDIPVHGVIVIANAASPEVLTALQARGIPLSLVSHEMRQWAIPSLRFNNEDGMIQLVRHLVQDCGRRRLAFVRGIPEQIDAKEREAAFAEAVLPYAPRLTAPIFLKGDFDAATAVESITRLLASSPEVPIDGVIAADDAMAAAIVKALRVMGIAVPQQIAVAGFGSVDDSDTESVTTVRADVGALGRRALAQLLHQIRGYPMRGVTTLSVNLQITGSTQAGIATVGAFHFSAKYARHGTGGNVGFQRADIRRGDNVS